MKLLEVVKALDLNVSAGAEHLEREVTGGYVGDLLSHVMARARPGTLWVTVQAHPNVVAVAALADLAGVIIAAGVAPDETSLSKAESAGVPVLTTPRSAYGVVAALVRLGIEEAAQESDTSLPR